MYGNAHKTVSIYIISKNVMLNVGIFGIPSIICDFPSCPFSLFLLVFSMGRPCIHWISLNFNHHKL